MVRINSYAINRSLDPVTQLTEHRRGLSVFQFPAKRGAPGAANILGLEHLADMADYLGYVSSAIAYRQQASLTRQGVD